MVKPVRDRASRVPVGLPHGGEPQEEPLENHNLCFPCPAAPLPPLGGLGSGLGASCRPAGAPPPTQTCPPRASAAPFLFLTELLFLCSPRPSPPCAPPCLPLSWPFLHSFYSWLDQPLPLSIPRKGLSCCWSRGWGPEPRRKPGPEATPPPPPARSRGPQRGGGARAPESILAISASKLARGCNLTSTCGG